MKQWLIEMQLTVLKKFLWVVMNQVAFIMKGIMRLCVVFYGFLVAFDISLNVSLVKACKTIKPLPPCLQPTPKK
jgi:hypothetical protein